MTTPQLDNIVTALRAAGYDASRSIDLGPTDVVVTEPTGSSLLLAHGHNTPDGWEVVRDTRGNQVAFADGPETGDASPEEIVAWIRSVVPPLTTASIHVDGQVTVVATFDSADRWNGWISAPFVDRANAETLVSWAADGMQPGQPSPLRFEGDVLVYEPEPGNDDYDVERVEANAAGLFEVGFGWVWSEVDDEVEA